jgi:hypothetical protein
MEILPQKRLEAHRQKTIKRNLFFLTIFFIFLIYFIFTIGLKILLTTSAFIANTFSPHKEENYAIKKNDFYGTIDINQIPEATNSASIIVSGQTTNYDIVEVYLNNQKVQEKDVTDNFSFQIDNLVSGENTIYFVAKSSKDRSTKKSESYTVLYKKEKPNLEITSPEEDKKTNQEEILISGKTDKNVFIEINSSPVVVNTLGEFQSTLKLQPGENKILITAQDIAGNVTSKELIVVYEKD